MQNVNDILKMLDTINADKAVETYVPSLKRVVKFKSINTGQQKNLIKAAMRGNVELGGVRVDLWKERVWMLIENSGFLLK